MDIRSVCKAFLEFIYENNVIPGAIVNVLSEYGAMWDICLVCEILHKRDLYATDVAAVYEQMVSQGGKLLSANSEMIYKIYQKRNDWAMLDAGIINWLNLCGDKINDIQTKMQMYSHDVTQEFRPDVVCMDVYAVVGMAPSEFNIDEWSKKILTTQSSNTGKTKTGTDNENSFYAKARGKIAKWARKPEQCNSKILWSYFKSVEIDGFATKDFMRGLCANRGMSEQQFVGNFNNMCIDTPNSHGKVFETDGDRVWVWSEVEDEVMKYKNDFLNGGN